MKYFLIKLFLFISIYLVIIQIPKNSLSFYYANEYFKIKYEYYQQNASNYNTIFIGSSKTYRHIIPQVYDSILTDYGFSSFNLGSPGTFNPQTYYLFENLLEKASDSLKYVFIDLQPISFIDVRNVNTTPNYYWHNLEYWKFTMEYIFSSDYSLKRKILLASGYTSSLIVNYSSIPDYKTLIGSSSEITKYWLGPQNSGQFSLDDHLLVSIKDTSFRTRKREFMADTSVITPRIQAAIHDFLTPNHHVYLNRVHLAKIKNMIRKAEDKGIRLVFLISPLSDNYNEQLAIKEQIPEVNSIEIADYHKYPDLYKAEMLFDVGHFNAKGSGIFSLYLANEMKKKLHSEKIN